MPHEHVSPSRHRSNAPMDSSSSSSSRTTKMAALRAFPHKLIRTKTSHSPGQRRQTFYVMVNNIEFRIWWLLIFLIHTVCMSFFGMSSWMYYCMPELFLGATIESYQLAMPLKYFHFICICHAAVAVVHGFFLLQMLLASIYKWKFAFTARWPFLIFRSHRRRRIKHPTIMNNVYMLMSGMLRKLFGRRGVFGVEGKYFELMFIGREVLETVLQSLQAYRMSSLIPRVMPNRFFVAILVSNCWMTPIAYHFYSSNPPLVRLMCLIVDIALDFVSTVGMPMTLILPYIQSYQPEVENFESSLWVDDVWLINMFNEAKLLLVSSWWDLGCRMLFSSSLVTCLQHVKSLLRSHNGRRVDSIRNSSTSLRHRSLVLTFTPVRLLNSMSLQVVNPEQQSQKQQQNADKLNSKSMLPPFVHHSERKQKRMTNIMHTLFILWGMFILALHISEERQESMTECPLHVRPWFSSRATCSLLQINCLLNQKTGTLEELDAILANVDPQTVVEVVFRHCSHIEMPSRLQDFSNLIGIKAYNSTLVQWGAEAALTRIHHPQLLFLMLICVHMDEIPQGLMSDDFPPLLRDIELSNTTLASLPDNLDKKFRLDGGVFVAEHSLLPAIPDVLLRMSASYLGLNENNFSIIPPEIFTNPSAVTIWLNSNPITELPGSLQPSGSIRAVHLTNTNLSVLPTWMDKAFFGHAYLAAGGSPFCKELLNQIKEDKKLRGNDWSPLDAYLIGSIDCTVETDGDALTYYPRIAEAALDNKWNRST